MTAVAYLAGVLLGDGWCTDGPSGSIGLRVSDEDFACAFAVALEIGTGSVTRPHKTRDGYWEVRNRNDSGRFSQIKSYQPETDEEVAAWLRGLFDSEGNATLTQKSGYGAESFNRSVAFYSTNMETLTRADAYLNRLGITTRLRQMRHSVGHLGTKPTFELAVRHDRENFLRFAWLVGSNLARKRATLLALPLSYQADPAESCRSAQLIGAAAKHQRTIDVTLPSVVEGVRKLLADGINPTQRACRSAVPGYSSIQRYVAQQDLIDMARGIRPIGVTKNVRAA